MRWIAIACAAAALHLAGSAGGEPLEAGRVLNAETAEAARDLLPPEILDHYRRGEYANGIDRWADGAVRWGEDFARASAENRQRLATTAEGTIVEKSSGARPPFIHGFPFPEVDAADPAAAVKVLWNYFYGYWSNGSRHNITQLTWVGRGGVDRSAVQDVYFLQYDGLPAEERPAANPNDLLQQALAAAMEPADLQGTVALQWRYRAANRRDSSWAHVPALRRVRQISPVNRSDGFLGSDMSQDDGPFFDAKPEDFTWRVVGQQDMLRLADPFSLKGDYEYVARPGGGWRVPFKPLPMVGFQDPQWKGVPWAPMNYVLVQRPAWVIEGVPHDRYYRFGKVHLYIDRENFRGAWTRKFDWKGELVSSYQIGGYLNGTPDGRHFMWGHGLYYQVSEDHKRSRATYAGIPPANWKDPANDFFVKLDPSFFDYQALVRFSK